MIITSSINFYVLTEVFCLISFLSNLSSRKLFNFTNNFKQNDHIHFPSISYNIKVLACTAFVSIHGLAVFGLAWQWFESCEGAILGCMYMYACVYCCALYVQSCVDINTLV